jgi:DNA-binding CsgD family transcriptional regulator/PAS domain-containing protein
MKLDDTLRLRILSELADLIEDFVLVLDPELRVLEANLAAARFFGCPTVDLIAKSLSSLIDGGERATTVELIRGAKGRRESTTLFSTRSKKRASAHLTVHPFLGPNKEPRCYLLVGRKEDKEYSAQAPSGLEVRMLKGFAAPLFIVDGLTRKVRECNEAAVNAFGFTREEIVGRRLLDHSQNAEEQLRNRSLETRAEKSYATAGLFRERILFPRKSAQPLPCDFIGLPLFASDGSLAFILAMLFDRSSEEEKEAEIARLIGQVSDIAVELARTAKDYSGRVGTKRLSDLGFTKRQIAIARLVAGGSTSKEIGFLLGIAESTVKNHLAVMYRKIGANSRISFLRALSAKRIKIE